MVQAHSVSGSISSGTMGLAGAPWWNPTGRPGEDCPHSRRRCPGHAHDQILDQLLGIERLAGGEGGTGGFALAALHAGVEAQQLLPGERRRRADAQRLAVQRQRAQGRELAARRLAETFGAGVEGQVQQAGKRMLHRAAARQSHGQLPGAHRQQRGGAQAGQPGQPRGGQRAQQQQAQRQRPQHPRQPVPQAARQPGGRMAAAQPDESQAGQHDQRGERDGHVQGLPIERQAVVERHQQHGGHRRARRGDVGARDVGIARHDVVQVDEVALGHGEHVQPADGGAAPGAPERGAAQRSGADAQHGKPEQSGDEGRKGGHGQKSLHRRSES